MPKETREDRPRGQRPPRKDRRGPALKNRGDRPDRQSRPDRREQAEHFDRQPFEPVVATDFYPEEEPFRVLSQAIRTSCRTFELFEIARLILEKPDRFVCVVRDPAQKEGEPARLYASVPDGLPFRSEEEALGHVFRHYIGEFFNSETVEVDPPSGSFQVVHKCGITGELLAPPNYHRYQAICREHHASKLAHLPYAKFEQRVESSREEADIQGWLEKMKQQTKFTSKENPELSFTSLEDARLYLVTNCREKLVRPAYSARFSGKALALLNPGDPIRRSVEYLLEGQRRFPLDTANHLRGRLRRMHFAVYKRGSKGVSFVCAVKRRFRKPEEVLADNLQELIDFIEAHPNFPLKELPKAFLGIDPARRSKASESQSEAARDMAREVAGEMGKPVEETVPEPPKTEDVQSFTDEEKASIRQLKNDLHYLVSEGYVTEYSDGRLFVPAIREEEIRHAEKQREAGSAPKPKPAPEPEAKAVPEPKPADKTEAKTEPETEPEPEHEAKSEPEVKTESEVKTGSEAEAKSEPEPEAEAKPEPEAEVEPEATPEPEELEPEEKKAEAAEPEDLSEEEAGDSAEKKTGGADRGVSDG